MGKRLVIALGGNAITRPGGPADITAQFAQTAASARCLVDLLDAGHELVVTHGNGPQVGATYRRAELADPEVYPLPLEICVASTQGGMGYMIAQCLQNELHVRGHDRQVTALVTTVLVDASDPAFSNPTKPIGPYYDKERARELALEGEVIRPVSGGRYRRVVASPRPLSILERDAIHRLVEAGELIIACGGGGIPVIRTAAGLLEGVAAVVDKDRASALLACGIHAHRFVILTAIDQVAVNFEKPNQRFLDTVTASELRGYIGADEFPAGSMGPKMEAALYFLEHNTQPDSDVVICTPEKAREALAGRAGTRIVRDGCGLNGQSSGP